MYRHKGESGASNVQSKLSILRAVDKHEPSLTLKVAVNKS